MIASASPRNLRDCFVTSFEQFQLGGTNSIRGYPEGDYLADMGGFLNLDWNFPNYLIPESWKLKNSDAPAAYQIESVIFADVGGGRLRKALAGEKRKNFLPVSEAG